MEVTFEIGLNPHSHNMIGKTSEKSASSNEITQNIGKAITEALENFSTEWLDKFREKILLQEYEQAYKIFDENKGRLQFCKNSEPIQILRTMDISQLARSNQMSYLTFLVGFTATYHDRSQIAESYLDRAIDEFAAEMDQNLLHNFYLEKANISADNGLRNKAVTMYKKIINQENISSGITAWAYQGLSLISEATEDIIAYSEKAADKHLESGNKNEAVKNFMNISNLKEAIDPNTAIKLIDKCIDLYGVERLIDRELLASLKHKKASFLSRIGQSEDAFPIIESVCELRRDLIGNEVELHASLILGSVIAEQIDKTDMVEKFRTEADILSKTIDDENFLLRQKISQLIADRKPLNDELLTSVISSNDKVALSAILLYQATDEKLKVEESLEYLDKAKQALESQSDRQLLDTIYYCIAERYRTEDLIDDAFENYKKSLSINPFFNSSAQNCISMLFEQKRWTDAEEFIRTRIDVIGELPNICFAYGKALYENRQFQKALKYFGKANKTIDGMQQYIQDCVNNIDDIELVSIQNHVAQPEISAEKFYNALEEFAISISAESRMHFWEYDKKAKGTYKWAKNPEELSKHMLITFLNGKFGQDAIEIIQEARAGAGFIDLYILLSGGLKIVVELKMCGSGYSSTYALSGESQIIHYQKNTTTKLGYLIVFDARKIDYGKHFKKLQTVNEHTIYTVAIDVRPEVIKR